jgi:hypothetical protein
MRIAELSQLFKDLPDLPIIVRADVNNDYTNYHHFSLDNCKVYVVWEYKYDKYTFYGEDQIKKELEYAGEPKHKGFKKYRIRKVILLELGYEDFII